MNFKTKIRPNDTLWTKYIRIRDKNTCACCGLEIYNMHNSGVSHFHNRRKESVRYEDDNCDLMHTIPCHQNWEHEKKEGRAYYNFKLKQLGEKRFNSLILQANETGSRDDEMSKLIIKKKIEELCK